MRFSPLLAVFGLCLACCPSLLGEVRLAPLFRDGAIFQRDKNVPIWGWAAPGEKISVRFGEQGIDVTADARGDWKVFLSPLSANAQPQELVVKGTNEVTVRDILVGDVWVCAGQSNMHWAVATALDAEKEKASANNSLIRYFGIANEVDETPQTDTRGEWKMPSPKTVGEFSATAYFFARELQPRLGIPIGIIKATPGGSGIEAWISREGLATLPMNGELQAARKKALEDFPAKQVAYKEAMDQWSRDAEAAKAAGQKFTQAKPRVPEGPLSRNAPSGLFNSNINPLLPYAIRGFLWYQGEANASRYTAYRQLFPTLIRQWRQDFGQGDLPFLFVQLANYRLPNDPSGQQWAFQREAQASVLTLPDTGMALAIDIGEEDDIHPRNKQEVGRRLALLAREKVYGESIDGQSPRTATFTPEKGAVEVTFQPAGPISLRGEKVLDLEVAGSDRKFHPAEARLSGDKLIVSSSAVPEPMAVRYLWRNSPTASLYGANGLPVAPFRSDDWP